MNRILPTKFAPIPVDDTYLFSVNTDIRAQYALEEASNLMAGVIEHYESTPAQSNTEYALMQGLKAAKALIDSIQLEG